MKEMEEDNKGGEDQYVPHDGPLCTPDERPGICCLPALGYFMSI